jgi:3-oxoacid CoA-transferase subunit A
MEKNHKYIAANATVDLANCSLYDLVFRLNKPAFKSQGRMKTTAKKDLKNMICDKLKSVDRYFTRVFNNAKFKDANSIHKAELILNDIFLFYFIIYKMKDKVFKKVYKEPKEALEGILFDGMTVMSGGFGLCGLPENLILALRDSGVRNLTVISNNAGTEGQGLGLLLETKQIKKAISSYVGENKLFEKQYLSGEIELEFNPQGTLAERVRAGGAGIPAFFTATGVGTLVSENKKHQSFNEKEYIMETSLVADLSIVKAWKGDKSGNLIYRKTARNFNPVMATAGKVTIAEVEELCEIGTLDPDHIHTPGIYVNRILEGRNYTKAIENLTLSED